MSGGDDWMSDCIYTIDQIKMYLAPVLSQYNVKSATLFGSYGKGSANAQVMWIYWSTVD